MHEMALCEGILKIVEDTAAGHAFARITRLRVEVGPFACVDPDALRFCFDAVMRGSPAEGAELDILTLPGRGLCFGCGAEVDLPARFAPCPRCGSGQVTPAGGQELRIKDMEVV